MSGAQKSSLPSYLNTWIIVVMGQYLDSDILGVLGLNVVQLIEWQWGQLT